MYIEYWFELPLVLMSTFFYTPSTTLVIYSTGAKLSGRYYLQQQQQHKQCILQSAIERKNELITLFLVLFAVCCRSNAFIMHAYAHNIFREKKWEYVWLDFPLIRCSSSLLIWMNEWMNECALVMDIAIYAFAICIGVWTFNMHILHYQQLQSN